MRRLAVIACGGLLAWAVVVCAPRGAERSRADESARPVPASRPAAPEAAASPDRARLERGWELIRVANWAPALKLLGQLRAESADPEVRAQATYALACIWHHRGGDADLGKAGGYYRQTVTNFAGTKAAPWAMLALARLAETPEKEPRSEQAREQLRAQARRQYRRIIEAHPGHMVADEATVWLAATHLARADDPAAVKQGADVLTAYLARRPGNYLAVVMHSMLADVHQDRGDYGKAVEHLIAAAAAGLPSEGDRARAYFRIARIAERRLGDYALAAKWYERIVTDARRDEKYHVAKLAAERCRKLAKEPRP